MSEVLILRRTCRSSDDDYDVLFKGAVVGRIYKDRAVANPELRWLWSITAIRPRPRRPVQMDGRAPTIGEAKAQFRAAWEAFNDGH